MIPTMLKIYTNNTEGKSFRFVFPVILIWILLFAVMIVFAPIMLIVALLAWTIGYGKLIIMFPVMLYSIIAALGDLLIDVKNKNETVYIILLIGGFK